MTAANALPGFHLAPKPGIPGLIAEGDWHGHLISVCASDEDQAGAIAVLGELYRDWPLWEARLLLAIADQDLSAKGIALEAISAHDEGYFEVEFIAAEVFGPGIALAVGTIAEGFEAVGTGG